MIKPEVTMKTDQIANPRHNCANPKGWLAGLYLNPKYRIIAPDNIPTAAEAKKRTVSKLKIICIAKGANLL
jgi:hypothetical protein